MCLHKVSLNIKFKVSSWKIDFKNTKNALVTWPAIMHIFNEVQRSYSIPSKIFTQVIHLPKNEIRWKEFKLSPGHRRTDGQTDGRTGWYNYTVAMDWLPMETNEWLLQQPEYMV